MEVTILVCLNFRDDRRHKIAKLESSLAEVTEKLSDVLVMVADLENKHVSLQTEQQSSSNSQLATAASPPDMLNAPDIVVEVHKTLADAAK